MNRPVTLRAIQPDDMAWLVAVNNAEVPAVNPLDESDMAAIISEASFAMIAEAGQGAVNLQASPVDEAPSDPRSEPLGFMLALTQTASYGSLNFRWFQRHFADFIYIDRIITAPSARGLGVGRAIYHGLFEFATQNALAPTCEVNERPPNPGSLKFHKGLGFEIVGRQDTDGGAKQVALMMRDQDRAQPLSHLPDATR